LGGGDNVAMRRVKGRLHPSLDGALSAPAARPAKWAARGPCHRAVGTDILLAQREVRWSTDDSINKAPRCTSGDAMTPGCRHIGGGTVARRN
jgi:hypothetical protein